MLSTRACARTLFSGGDPDRSIRFTDHTIDEVTEILDELDRPAPSRLDSAPGS